MATKKRRSSAPEDQLPALAVQKILIEHIYEEAQEKGQFLIPWAALGKADELARILVGPEDRDRYAGDVRLDQSTDSDLRRLRDTHYYAVDLFYKTCYGLGRKGRPKLSPEHHEHLLKLREQGLSHSKIAKKLGVPLSASADRIRSTDKVRQRLKAGKKA